MVDPGAAQARAVDAPVVIVGGGPVGLSLALGPAHHGVRSVVVERDAEPVRESRALAVWPRTLEVYRAWGALDPLLAAGTFHRQLRPVDARNERPLLTLDVGALDDVTPVAGALIVPQDRTEALLRRLVRSRPECELRIGECTDLGQDDDGVRIEGRDGDGPWSLRAAFAVGCDGAHSRVRGALGLHLEGETYPTRVVLHDEGIGAPELSPIRLAPDRPGFLAALRFAPDAWRIIASVPPDQDDDAAQSDAARRERVAALFGNRASKPIWLSLFRIHRRHSPRFRLGRLLLAGDAAHLNSPAGGQGMNAGVQDAANLAWKLAAALAGGDVEALLESYDRERRGQVRQGIERTTDRLTRIQFGLPPAARRAALRAFALALHLPVVQEKGARALSMLDGRYADSPLLAGDHRLVGARLDDVRIDGDRRLSDRLVGRGGVVAIDAPSTVGGDDTIVVHLRRAPRSWNLHQPSCLVVRPDGVIGAVVEPPTPEGVAAARGVALGRGPARENVASP